MDKSRSYYTKHLISVLFFVLILSIVVSGAFFNKEKPLKVSLENTEAVNNSITSDKSMHIGVFSMASPKTSAEYYQGFIEYLSSETGMEFELVQRDNPAEINYLLETGYLDMVFVREDTYFRGHDDFGMKIIAVPVIHGDLHYSSYVISKSDSDIDSLDDLRGKKFAFNSYRFAQGEIVPRYMSLEINESPDSYFSEYIYSNSQDNFIDMISHGTLDGAEIDCLMWCYFVESSSYYSSQVQIIHSSPPQLVPAIAVHPDLEPDMESRIKDSLLHMHNSEEGRKILDTMYFNMFVDMDHEIYLSYGDELQVDEDE